MDKSLTPFFTLRDGYFHFHMGQVDKATNLFLAWETLKDFLYSLDRFSDDLILFISISIFQNYFKKNKFLIDASQDIYFIDEELDELEYIINEELKKYEVKYEEEKE